MPTVLDSSPITVIGMLERAPPDTPLLVLPHETLTYGEVCARSARLAAALAAKGIGRGDRVAVLLPNTAAWFLVAAACARLGVALVSLNVRLGAREIGDFVARARCSAIFYDSIARAGEIARALATVPMEKLSSVKLQVCCAAASTAPENLASLLATKDSLAGEGAADDPFYIAPTSGTTSTPKLVVHTQRRVVHHAYDVARAFSMRSGGKVLLALPLCGAYGFTTAMVCVAAGLPLVLHEMFEAGVVAEAIERHGITHLFGTNDMLAALLATNGRTPAFPKLEIYGNANFTPGLPDLPRLAESRGVPITGMYGMTETMAFLAAQPNNIPVERRAGGGGYLICPTAQFRIRDPQSGELAKPGAEGELEVLTPDVTVGYFEDTERTAAAFTTDGYLRTGDIARANTDGTFDFIARAGDVLRVGGYLVSPAEIEDVIMAAAPLAACQVVEVSHENRARPVAFVVPKSGEAVSEAVIAEVCGRDLAVYKRPIRIFVVETLPMVAGPNGAKVQKHVLREQAATLLAREDAAPSS